MKRRRHNPFNHPQLYEAGKVNETLSLIQKIMENADKVRGTNRHEAFRASWDQSLIPDLDPQNIYTPLNIVAQVLDPKVTHQVLKALLSENAPIYRDMVESLEGETHDIYDMNQGVVPPSWLKPRKRGSLELSSPFERDFGDPSIGRPGLAAQAMNDLNWGPKPSRRKASRKRKMRRRGKN